MINIKEIFPETPDIKSNMDCHKIHEIAGTKPSYWHLFENAERIKKLYDERRILFIRLFDILSNHTRRCIVDKYGRCQDHTKFTGIETKSADISKCDCDIKDAFEIVERIARKPWEELRG
jgi:hypothetical protein